MKSVRGGSSIGKFCVRGSAADVPANPTTGAPKAKLCKGEVSGALEEAWLLGTKCLLLQSGSSKVNLLAFEQVGNDPLERFNR